MARIKLLRQRLGWSQKRMAEHLKCSQPTIARMEAGQPEPGPVAILLDQLDASHPEAAPVATPVNGPAPADQREVAA